MRTGERSGVRLAAGVGAGLNTVSLTLVGLVCDRYRAGADGAVRSGGGDYIAG